MNVHFIYCRNQIKLASGWDFFIYKLYLTSFYLTLISTWAGTKLISSLEQWKDGYDIRKRNIVFVDILEKQLYSLTNFLRLFCRYFGKNNCIFPPIFWDCFDSCLQYLMEHKHGRTIRRLIHYTVGYLIGNILHYTWKK